MPKRISECGDVLLWGFLSDYVGVMAGAGLLTLPRRVQASLVGVLKTLSGDFMPGQVIFFAVVPGAAATGLLSRYLL